MIGSLNLKLDYYNEKLALWEPIIEPKAETRNQKVNEKKWDLSVTLRQNASSDFGSGNFKKHQLFVYILNYDGRKQILDGYAVLNSKFFFVKYSEICNFYYIKSSKHGYANAYPAYPVPPPPCSNIKSFCRDIFF